MRENLSKLMRDLENQIGTRDMVNLILEALLEAIKDYKEINDKNFCDAFLEVLKDVKNTTPRIGLLIEDFYEIWQEIDKEEHCAKHKGDGYLKCKDLKQVINKKVRSLQKQSRKEDEQITENAIKEIKKGDTILIHTNSHTVLDALKAAIRKKRFSCIVAEQEHEKTLGMILELQKAHIPFKVVPEYMLSHIENEVSKVFIGAVTLNSFHHIVSNAGTKAVVSEFQGKVPIYTLMSTKKCSFWKAKSLHHSYEEKQIKSHTHSEINYSRIKFSHDRVPLEIINFVITEKGTFKSKNMLEWYKTEFKKRTRWRKKFISR